jgi:DNA polymerase III subunit epsilon
VTNITILDTETDGFKATRDKVVEVAAILYNLEAAAPIASFAALLKQPSNAAAAVNGISVELLQSSPTYFAMAKAVISEFVGDSVAIAAHCASFDKPFIAAAGLLKTDGSCDKPWVCTMQQVRWPKAYTSKSLTAIALAHGVPVVAAHRALTDCDILARLLTRVSEMGHSLTDLLNNALKPRFLVEALVDYDNRQLAKDANFEWNQSEEFPKKWLREVTDEELASITTFQCRRLASSQT